MADNSEVLNDLSREYRAARKEGTDPAPVRAKEDEAPIAPAPAPAPARPAAKRLPKDSE
jgi:hypothetical protein